MKKNVIGNIQREGICEIIAGCCSWSQAMVPCSL